MQNYKFYSRNQNLGQNVVKLVDITSRRIAVKIIMLILTRSVKNQVA